jgi:hypothetical protein
MLCGSPALGQTPESAPIEVPLWVQDGRLMVTVDGPDGAEYDFVLGLGMTLITEGGAARIGESIASLTLGGIPVETEQASTVPDEYLVGTGATPAGVLGGLTLNKFDVLIDAPNNRLVLKPIGRTVTWDGVSLSNPVRMMLFHDVLARIEVEIGGTEYAGLLDLASPYLEVNEPIRTAGGVVGDSAPSFRMGYAGWTDLPTKVTEAPLFQGWDPDGHGFVVVGAPVAYDCQIAISWAHAELRTCVR